MKAIALRDIVYPALRLIGILETPGRGYSTSEQTDSLEALNSLIDSWFADRLNVFTIQQRVFTFSPMKQLYTIGIDPTNPGNVADFVAERPEHIESANVITSVSGGPAVRIPLAILESVEWAAKRVLNVNSTIPQDLYCDYDAPLSKLYLYPMPALANQLELYTWKPIPQWTTLNDLITLPAGYLRALQYNLAVDLAPRYPKRGNLSPVVVQTAAQLKSDIERRNAPSPTLSCDLALSGGRKSSWNYTTGDS